MPEKHKHIFGANGCWCGAKTPSLPRWVRVLLALISVVGFAVIFASFLSERDSQDEAKGTAAKTPQPISAAQVVTDNADMVAARINEHRPPECQYLAEGKSLDDCLNKATAANLAHARAYAGVLMLRSFMRDPESFQLEQALLMTDGSACYKYRSRNGFGGMNRGFAVLTTKGRLHILDPEDESRNVTPWNRSCANKSGELLPIGEAGK